MLTDKEKRVKELKNRDLRAFYMDEDSSGTKWFKVYIGVFENEESAKAYLEMHTARLKGFGIAAVNAKIFDINEALSKITKGPFG